MAKAEDVIRIAIGEIGYHEKASNAKLDDKTANSGDKNWTKYARDLDALGDFYNGKKQGLAYCDMFNDWCHYMANGKDENKTLYEVCQPKKSAGAGCLYSYRYYKNAGRAGKTPKVGAQIFYGTSADKISHTGIVEKFDSNYVYAIEGNVSNQIKRVKTPLNSPKIQGYGYPRYDVEPTGNGFDIAASTITTALEVHEMGYLTKDVKATGEVTADKLNVRTLPGAENPQLRSVPFITKGTVIEMCDAVKAKDGGVWYYIRTSGKYGFVSSKYIKLKGTDNISYQDGTASYSTR